MSAVGAAMGLDIILFVPYTAPINKLMQSVLYGAKVIPVKGTYDDAFKLSIEYTKLHGGINRNTAYNPMTIEGKKSISIELFEQLGRKAPDAVYVPVGDGCSDLRLHHRRCGKGLLRPIGGRPDREDA